MNRNAQLMPKYMLKRSRKNTETTNKTHLMLMLILLVITVNKIAQLTATETATTYHIHTLTSCLIQKQVRLRTQFKNDHKCFNRTNQTLILLLLLLSNDIHPNPGPVPVISHTTANHVTCTTCNEQIKDEPAEALQCEQCHNWSHIKCIGINQRNKDILDGSFEWICATDTCSPNHVPSIQHLNHCVSPNRYKLLVSESNIKESNNVSENKKSRKNVHEYNLMNELPKITARDYIGKDLCRSCYKEVKICQQAISCDLCTKWIHRICSDMSIKTYNQCKKKKQFTWICNKCRSDDIQIDGIADLTKLKVEDQPDKLTEIEVSGNDFLVLNLNCRSALNKAEEIQYITNKLNPDIICLTETWFDDSVPLKTCVPDGYKIIRKDRSDEFKQKYGRNKGGGVAVLYKDHIKVEKKEYLTDKVEEMLWVQVRTKQSFMLGIIYRSEYTDILLSDDGESKLEENVRKAAEISDRLIITGDFNIDTSDNTCKLAENLKNIYKPYNLSQLIKKPTRVDKIYGRATIIDHVWTNTELQLINKVGTFVGVSDHFGTYMKLNLQKVKVDAKIIRHRSYKNYNAAEFNKALEKKLLDSNIKYHIEHCDTNSATEELIKIMQVTAENHAPIKEIKINPKKTNIPWYTEELKDMITQKNSLIKDWYYYGFQSFKTRICKINNSISHLKRKLKKMYVTEMFEEAHSDSKKCWKILNVITNRTKAKDTVEPEMLNQEKVNKYNKYFATVGLEIQKKLKINTYT